MLSTCPALDTIKIHSKGNDIHYTVYLRILSLFILTYFFLIIPYFRNRATYPRSENKFNKYVPANSEVDLFTEIITAKLDTLMRKLVYVVQCKCAKMDERNIFNGSAEYKRSKSVAN